MGEERRCGQTEACEFVKQLEECKKRVEELTSALMVPCSHCGKPAVWRLEWSDREQFVCNEVACIRKAQHNHDFDHLYDQVKDGPYLDTWWAQNSALNLPKRPTLPAGQQPNKLPDLFKFLHPGVELRVAEQYKVKEYDGLPACKKCGCLVIDGSCVNVPCVREGG
jgi:hypothetical protein